MIGNKSLSLSGPQFPPVLSLPLWGSNEVMYRLSGSLWVFHKCDLSFLSLDPAPCPYSPNTDVRKRALSPPGMGTPTQHGQRNSSPPHHCQLQPSRGHLCSERGFPPPQRTPVLTPSWPQQLSLLPFPGLVPDPFPGPFVSLWLRGVDVTPS